MKTNIVLALALQLSLLALAQTVSPSAAPQIGEVRSGQLHLKGAKSGANRGQPDLPLFFFCVTMRGDAKESTLCFFPDFLITSPSAE